MAVNNAFRDSLGTLHALRPLLAGRLDDPAAADAWRAFLGIVRALCRVDAVWLLRTDGSGTRSVLTEHTEQDEAARQQCARPEFEVLLGRTEPSGYAVRPPNPHLREVHALAVVRAFTESSQFLVLLVSAADQEGMQDILLRAQLLAESIREPSDPIAASIGEPSDPIAASIGEASDSIAAADVALGMLDMLAEVYRAAHFQIAAYAVVNGIAGHAEVVDQVVLGWRDGAYIKVRAISHYERFERKTDTVKLFEAALEEAADQFAAILFGPESELGEGSGATGVASNAASSDKVDKSSKFGEWGKFDKSGIVGNIGKFGKFGKFGESDESDEFGKVVGSGKADQFGKSDTSDTSASSSDFGKFSKFGEFGDGQITLAHRQLRVHLSARSLFTFPVVDRDGEPTLVLMLVSYRVPPPARVLEAVHFVAQTAMPRLEQLALRDAGWFKRGRDALTRSMAWLLGRDNVLVKSFSILAGMALLASVVMTTTHRVEGSGQFVTDATRLVTAPFDGVVTQAWVSSGDEVAEGDPLAELDTQELMFQLAELQAELQRNLAEADKARAEFNSVELAIANARSEQVRARIERVRFMLAQARLLAPLTGVVVEGERRELISAPVSRGQPLYRIATNENLYLSLLVGDDDIVWLEVGQQGMFALISQPDVRIPMRVTTIVPMASVEGAGGARFRVLAEVEQTAEVWWRPGMTGVAKIAIAERSYMWVFTHKLINRIRLVLW